MESMLNFGKQCNRYSMVVPNSRAEKRVLAAPGKRSWKADSSLLTVPIFEFNSFSIGEFFLRYLDVLSRSLVYLELVFP